MEDYDVAIIGGGIAGLAAAAEIAPWARVAVLEAEDQPGYHATGRSAAILAQNYGDALIRALTAWSAPRLGGPEGAFLRRRGLVRAAEPGHRAALERLYAEMGRDWPLVWLEAEEVSARAPLLRPGWAECGFANDEAADIDVAGLAQHRLRTMRAAGGTLLTKAEATRVVRKGGRWRIGCANGREVAARVVVNAAGAWADRVAEEAGAAPLGLVPMRRTAVTFDAPPDADLAAHPMVVDAAERLYFKPEGGRLMASPSDETPDAPGDSRPDELDVAICLDAVEKATGIAVRRPRATWSGLRTFAPDRAPVCGWDPACAGFYWLAGQGGSGVQTAPALARLAADDVLGRDGAARTAMAGVDLAVLGPARLAGTNQRKRQGVYS